MAPRQAVVCNFGLARAAQAQSEARTLTIDHMAVGTGQYSPDGTETGLVAEIARKGIARSEYKGNGQWAVTAEFDEDDLALGGSGATLFNEIGFYASDSGYGDDVMLYVISDPIKAISAVAEAGTTAITITIALGVLPDGSVTIDVLDPGPIAQSVLDDLSHRHAPGEEFNTVAMRDIEQWETLSAETVEHFAQVMRQTGQSGILGSRSYNYGGDAPHHRPGMVSFSAMGVHNHPNYRMMSGFPELEAVLNGYSFKSRHLDYRWKEAVQGAYASMADPVDPVVPPSVLGLSDVDAATEEMRQYLLAYHYQDPTIRADYADYFDVHMSYVECWWEILASGDALAEFGESFRHQNDEQSWTAMIADAIAQMATGAKSRFENTSYIPRVIRLMRDDGEIVFAALRYRIGTKRLGTLTEWPVHRMLAQVDDPRVRVRDDVSQDDLGMSTRARWRVLHALDDDSEALRTSPGLIDQIMGMIPGLEGGGDVPVIYQQRKSDGTLVDRQEMISGTSTPRNGAYYSRFYSYSEADAAGRTDYRRGFSDGGTFTAFTTHPEVVDLQGMGGGHRMTWAFPLELLVAPPTMAWNPHNIAITTGAITGDGATSGTPYSAAKADAYWHLTPAGLFTGDTVDEDPANTGAHLWMEDGDGTARLCAASGSYVLMPKLSTGERLRTRFQIAPAHWEGHPLMGEITARQTETRSALAAQIGAVADLYTRMIEKGLI